MSTGRLAAEQDAIDGCDNEPIHLIGTVQPVGWLIGTTADAALVITHVSANASEMAHIEPSLLLNTPLASVLPEEAIHAVRNSLGHSTIGEQRSHIGRFGLVQGDGIFDVALHAMNDTAIIELQPADHAAGPGPTEALATTQRIVNAASRSHDIEQLLQRTIEELRSFTGYDRVNAYRFLPDGAGEILAESRTSDIDSLLGLRFPAFDIPPAARRLYASTPIRVVSDVKAAQVPILAASPDAEEVDLRLAVLRGCVADHLVYLTNMGLRSTMSLPLVVQGEMWGFLAFHHREPRHPSTTVAQACELMGRSVSMALDHTMQRDHAERIERCSEVSRALFSVDDSPLGYASYWETARSDLATLVPCDGVALLGQERVDTYGNCPDPTAVRQIHESMLHASQGERTPVAIESLADTVPDIDASASAGALLLLEPLPFFDGLIFFRDETKQKVRWAGDSSTSYVEEDGKLRLNPRTSFAEYLDERDGRCDPWSGLDVATATALGIALQRVYSAGDAQQQHRERLGLVVRELNHRVRNILALVRSLVGQTQDSATTVTDYVESLEERIAALASAHSLLTEADWKPVSLAELIDRTVGLYRTNAPHRILSNGPWVGVPANLASMLALVLHELASNAVKYGALSNTGGEVLIEWNVEDEGLMLTWSEQNGPPVTPPATAGFGSSIVQNALPFEFDATSTLDFASTGVVASFLLPHAAVQASPPLTEPTNSTLRVLVLEDDYIISQQMAAHMEQLGASTVTAEATVHGALAALEAHSYDFALLDANVRGEFSGPVAQWLDEAAVPFVFVTGYGSRDQELQESGALTILTKPTTEDDLAGALRLAGLLQ